jgi:septal ring factor EnvC (AmiA/AmiB activator)
MTRIKEVKPGSGDIPEYKSPSSRLVPSLRNAYDNARVKIADLRKTIKYYQIKTRDLGNSRDKWKNDVTELKHAMKDVQDKNDCLEKENANFLKEVESTRNCKKKARS